MDEAIRNPGITTRHGGPAISAELAGEVFTRRVITVVLAAITALTFAFGFGNVWALGRSLGVPPFVAPLVAPLVGPAVDLSVAGLLIGIQHLPMAGVPRDQLCPARILVTACGAATLALNIAGPVSAGAYGRAAFDSVGPGLLIGWAETGPGMLRFLYVRPSNPDPALDGSLAPPAHISEELPAGSTSPLNSPASDAEADGPSRPDLALATARQASPGPPETAARPARRCHLPFPLPPRLTYRALAVAAAAAAGVVLAGVAVTAGRPPLPARPSAPTPLSPSPGSSSTCARDHSGRRPRPSPHLTRPTVRAARRRMARRAHPTRAA
jgi:hypothetical protein